MNKIKREEFLDYFLKSLGAKQVILTRITADFIEGKVIYDFQEDDEDGIQMFCWKKSISSEISTQILHLIKTIYENKLLSIDKITVPKIKLLDIYNKDYQDSIDIKTFEQILEELFIIEVDMIDKGEKFDSFFIHS